MRTVTDSQNFLRTRVLKSFGANEAVTEELLVYNESRFTQNNVRWTDYPNQDEEFVPIWQQYADQVRTSGTILALAPYLPQLRFPIKANISSEPGYLAAVRQGAATEAVPEATGLVLCAPELCHVMLYETACGRLPVIICEYRRDFVSLVQALTKHNEPVTLPDSIGAMMVSGYNNWHRVTLLKEKLIHQNATGKQVCDFNELKKHKHLYQDRFVLAATGPYSGVHHSSLQLDRADWLALSLTIRLEHEATHYFTRRVFGSMRNNLLDELIADFCGLHAAFGRVNASFLLCFLGFDPYPNYRLNGRFEYYLNNPLLSSAATQILMALVNAAAFNLEAFSDVLPAGAPHKAALLFALSTLTLEELAAPEALQVLRNRYNGLV